ncbi:MAG: 16S rRNA (cytosine(1402)-N(4))-methyltransferase RsmH [Candidatus Latescibacteria bacterium]|nr:16S rRNA (cytosine(1402)-N(4))-methyltransferase RsmH [Candidatus Latescibacterota bacterium]
MTENNQIVQFHVPVMTQTVIQYLLPCIQHKKYKDKSAMYIDATLGSGGHSQAILENISDGIVVGIDLDIDAIEYSKNRLKDHSNFHIFHTSYTNLDQIVSQFPDYALKGVLFDLGISSHQISKPNRGFSYSVQGILDMRFDQSNPIRNAKDIIQRSSEYELSNILFKYGEERFARNIARQIHEQRRNIRTTFDLAQIVRSVVHGKNINKSLSRVFQALRILVNNELDNVKIGLSKAIDLCATGARLVVITYHSLEDRIVKQIFRDYAQNNKLQILTKKPIRPLLIEINNNPSARSAHLRAAQKV